VAGDLAALSDVGILLDLDESPDFCLVADFAAVQVDELGKFYVLPKLYIGSDADVFAHR
jgi:hypothetical protein